MNYTAHIERINDLYDNKEIQPLHKRHWMETEGYRHGIGFNPDYGRVMDYERRGMYLQFTLRCDGELVGACGMYLQHSMHTQKPIATEDSIFVVPEHRKGGTAKWFIGQVEEELQNRGVTEIRISVKMVNKAAKLFERLGYQPVAIEMVKTLEAPDVLRRARSA